MQNRYVGDIGDFGKYALLRNILRTGSTLGVNWYLTPDEKHNSDGKHISYLHKSNYIGYDDELFYILKDIVDNNRRNVFSVQKSVIPPRNPVYYDSILDLTGEPDYLKRCILRQSWHISAINKLKDCEIVFLDPDFGLTITGW